MRLVSEAFYTEPVYDDERRQIATAIAVTVWEREEGDPPGRLVCTESVEVPTDLDGAADVLDAVFTAIEDRVPDVVKERIVHPELRGRNGK